jgi:hypothetical protein
MEALILPLKSASFKANSEIQQSNFRLGTSILGLKQPLYDQKWKISTGLQFQARTSKYDGTTV